MTLCFLPSSVSFPPSDIGAKAAQKSLQMITQTFLSTDPAIPQDQKQNLPAAK